MPLGRVRADPLAAQPRPLTISRAAVAIRAGALTLTERKLFLSQRIEELGGLIMHRGSGVMGRCGPQERGFDARHVHRLRRRWIPSIAPTCYHYLAAAERVATPALRAARDAVEWPGALRCSAVASAATSTPLLLSELADSKRGL
jgi:hypothetical protein